MVPGCGGDSNVTAEGKNWVLMRNVVLACGVPAEVVPEERIDAVAMGGALALEKVDLSADR